MLTKINVKIVNNVQYHFDFEKNKTRSKIINTKTKEIMLNEEKIAITEKVTKISKFLLTFE